MPNLRRCLLLLALALAAPAWAQAPGSSEFAAGVAAYRKLYRGFYDSGAGALKRLLQAVAVEAGAGT